MLKVILFYYVSCPFMQTTYKPARLNEERLLVLFGHLTWKSSRFRIDFKIMSIHSIYLFFCLLNFAASRCNLKGNFSSKKLSLKDQSNLILFLLLLNQFPERLFNAIESHFIRCLIFEKKNWFSGPQIGFLLSFFL